MTGLLLAALFAFLQSPPPTGPQGAPQGAPVERLGPSLFRVGNIRVDTAKREISVTGHMNADVRVLEFAANARAGLKAYETAMTLDTDAINFNLALVLIGLDRKNARPAQRHFDPATVEGDPVAVTVEYNTPNGTERGPIELLLVDKESGAPVQKGEWVYTGSVLFPDGRYAAEVDGVLIGFAHTPSSIIESVKGIAVGRYGTIAPNPKIPPTTPITVRVSALGGRPR